MKAVPRMGLLLATLALPLGALLTSHLLREQPLPPAPTSVQIGESHPGSSFGQPSTPPSTPPSPTAARPLVVGERATSTSSTPPSRAPTGPPTSAPVETSAPEDADPADPNGAGSKGKAKGRNSAVPSHLPPSHAATPGNNGSGG